ncbi:hypothetical protein VA596_50115 [Amycolatopsis sp., V23-08]|uniref:Uncharacterized protein n=1 Tax=Amycolatopsis heterodermiae TaxID=3110235 RepID=A0ABU5RN81_9PSEU|nr:hypothetical protein [Amycolatopsis sp., V23-08]MEA5367768.1 hypothetical protein [Amycolatopsis sp., V23-08]
MTPQDKISQTRAAAHRSWAKTSDRSRRTAPAREAADARFEHEVDPEGRMTPQARALAAASARKAYYQELARKSVASRRRARAAS